MSKNDMENPSYFAIIPANVRYDPELSANAKLLYGEVTSLCNKYGYCFASNAYFAELYNVSLFTVSRWVSSLVKNGYLFTKVVYKDNTKEIEERRISIVPFDENGNTPLTKNSRGLDENVKGVLTKMSGGLDENRKENNKLNNTSINKCMGDEPPASAPKEKRKAFIKPTLEEVKAYCIERKNNVDPQRFFDYYESNGWKVGKNTMKDWKAAVRTWERNGYSNNAPVKQGTCGDNKPKDFDFFNF